MAYYNESRLPIRSSTRDGTECQRPATQKYASSLRIPEDTSWPKIPERKLHENFNNPKAPYVVAFTGKAPKNHVVQLPHSQFIKAAPKDDTPDRNIPLNTPFRTTITDRPSTTADPRFKTTVTTPDNAQNPTNDVSRKEAGKSDVARDNDNNKIWRASSVQNVCEKFESEKKNDENASTVQNPNVDVDKTENLVKQDAHPTIFNSGFKTLNNSTKNNVPLKKEESRTSNKSSSSTRKPPETSSRGASRKLRPLQPMSDTTTTTDSEVPSRGRIRKIVRCRSSEDDTDTTTKCEDHTRNSCCHRGAVTGKYLPRRDDGRYCFCIRCRNFWPTTKLAPHSDPQMGSSKNRRCSTPYCCPKNLHRAVSESDCTAIKTTHRERKNQSFDDFLSYTDALKVLLSKEGRLNRDEIASKARILLERNFFNNVVVDGKKKNDDDEEFRYACQLAMGAPRMKRRKSDRDGVMVSDHQIDNRVSNRDPNITSKPQGDKQQVDSLVELKTAGIIAHRHIMILPVYAILVLTAILLLPTVYDYFFYEEEEIEEPSYLELVIDYVISSFQEAFGGLFDAIAKVFFQSRTCRKCSSSNTAN